MVLVRGELGAGKTTLVRGAARALGVTDPVTSPTFGIGHRYRGSEVTVAHLDLYRLAGLEHEAPGLLEDYLTADSIAFVEWPEEGSPELEGARAQVTITHGGGDRRRIEVLEAHELEAGVPAAGAGASASRVRRGRTRGDDRAGLRYGHARDRRGVAARRRDHAAGLRRARAGERPGHTTRSLALASELLVQAGIGWGALERIAVGVGPGTFTGLRVGIATARGLAQSLGIEVVGVSSLQVLAQAALREPDPQVGQRVLAAIDARRGEAFAAAYDAQGELAPPRALPPEDLAAIPGHSAGNTIGWPSATERYAFGDIWRRSRWRSQWTPRRSTE